MKKNMEEAFASLALPKLHQWSIHNTELVRSKVLKTSTPITPFTHWTEIRVLMRHSQSPLKRIPYFISHISFAISCRLGPLTYPPIRAFSDLQELVPVQHSHTISHVKWLNGYRIIVSMATPVLVICSKCHVNQLSVITRWYCCMVCYMCKEYSTHYFCEIINSVFVCNTCCQHVLITFPMTKKMAHFFWLDSTGVLISS